MINNKLNEALQASCSFRITGDSSAAKKLCLLPGIYDTREVVSYTVTEGSSTVTKYAFSLTNKTSLTNAGYTVDQVADDYVAELASKMPVSVTTQDMASYRDFLNKVQRSGAVVTKITIKNLAGTTYEEIFNQLIEVSKTALGAKGGTDFIRLQKYVSVNAYDRSKIEIDLSDDTLNLDDTIFMALNVPANADFTITFDFA